MGVIFEKGVFSLGERHWMMDSKIGDNEKCKLACAA